MSQNYLKFWDKFETKLRTDLRPYRDNLETYLTILLLRANWDIFETWVHSDKLSSYKIKCQYICVLFEIFLWLCFKAEQSKFSYTDENHDLAHSLSTQFLQHSTHSLKILKA